MGSSLAGQGAGCGAGDATDRPETRPGQPGPLYCPVCGREASDSIRRLGESFCSEAHAGEFGREVQRLLETTT